MEPILLIILFALLAFLSDQLGGKKKIPARPRRDIDAQLPPSVPQPWPGQRRDAPSPAHELQPAVITSPAAPAMAPADHQPQSTAEPGLAGQVSPAAGDQLDQAGKDHAAQKQRAGGTRAHHGLGSALLYRL